MGNVIGYVVVGAVCLGVGTYFGARIKTAVGSLETKVETGLAKIEAAIKAGKL